MACHKKLIARWQKVPFKTEIDESYYIFDYQKDRLAKKLIHSLKYQFIKEMADVLGVTLANERLNFKKMMFDAIVPIPLHRRRLRERGFNQSYLIAQKISELTEKPILADVIKRKIYRRAQMEVKNREARIKNTQNIFECIEHRVFDKKVILLVDDVATTGATLKECARVLKNAGAGKILSFTLAQD